MNGHIHLNKRSKAPKEKNKQVLAENSIQEKDEAPEQQSQVSGNEAHNSAEAEEGEVR